MRMQNITLTKIKNRVGGTTAHCRRPELAIVKSQQSRVDVKRWIDRGVDVHNRVTEVHAGGFACLDLPCNWREDESAHTLSLVLVVGPHVLPG